MCYHYAIKAEKKDIEQKVGLLFDDNNSWESTIKTNCFSSPLLPVVVNDSKNKLKLLKWGLVPHWVNDKNITLNMANAMCEGIFEKPSWRIPIIKNRCLIPATGFYEWKTEGNKKIPYFIYLPNQPIFYFGGIWDRWTDKKSGETIESFSIITTPANKLMEEIHNTKKRMPLIISNDIAFNWLQNDLDKNKIRSFLIPFDTELMKAEKVLESPKKDNNPGTLTLF